MSRCVKCVQHDRHRCLLKFRERKRDALYAKYGNGWRAHEHRGGFFSGRARDWREALHMLVCRVMH